VIGYVNFKEMVYFMSTNPADPTLTGIMRPVHFADPEGSAADLLRVFVGQHEHMAIARDEDGRAIGLVTLEDLIEEVVGEVEDEFDRLPRYRHALPGGTWVFGGGTPMDEVSQSLRGLLPAGRETLATWMAKRLGVVPTGGQAVRIDDVEILVRRMRRGQVFEASVTPGH
jgi:putative hemolysin